MNHSVSPHFVQVASPLTAESVAEHMASIADRSVVRAVLQAHRLLVQCQYRHCVLQCCEIAEKLLASRIDPVVFAARQGLGWPNVGVRLSRTELGPRTELIRHDFARNDCELLLAHIVVLCERLSGARGAGTQGAAIAGNDTIPERRMTETLVINLRNLSRKCISSDLSLRIKRPLLRVLGMLRFSLVRLLPHGSDYLRGQAHLLGLVLHEPEREMLLLLRQFDFHTEYNYACRLAHLRKTADSARHLDAFHWPDREAYQDYITSQTGSRVLVTIHMGDFLGAFTCIASLAQQGRKAISLRREVESEQENTHFLSERLNHKVIRHGIENPISIVSALRKGNHSLSVMFDLKEDFGETVPVTFFGQPSRFVKGPAQLAIMGRAPILPFVTWRDNGVNRIDMESIIDTELYSNESLAQATARITQMLVKLAEKWIRRSPAQWKYLPSLPEYFRHE